MKKRILAVVLALATVSSIFTMFASAVPYSPSANGWKDFSQEHNYIYEVKKGHAVPKIDGLVTEKDGYGEPIASYGFRYVSTADKYRDDLDNGEYKLKDNGDYYVYPTVDSPDGIWDSITNLETDNPSGYLNCYYVKATEYTTSSLYFYNIETDTFTRAYKVTEENFDKYEAMNSSGNYYLQAVQTLEGEPLDWETNFANYYTKSSSCYTPVQPTTSGTAPAFKPGTYYYGERIKCADLFTLRDLGVNYSVARIAWMRRDHFVVPEEINLYARYDDKYLYYAVEVHEPEHQRAYYNLGNTFGTSISNNLRTTIYGNDYCNYYRKGLTDDQAKSALVANIRTYVNAGTKLSSTAPILAKFGNPDATYNEVQVSGIDYTVVHTPAPKVEKPKEEQSDDMLMGGEFGGGFEEEVAVGEEKVGRNGIKESLRSGTYGTTVYEYRLPWVVINGKYSPDTCTTAVPEIFTAYQTIQMDNKIGSGTHTIALAIPRYVYNSRSSFGLSNYTLRYPDRTALTEGKDYGTYNFYWKVISGTTTWDAEPYTTDYFDVSSRKKSTVYHLPPMFFTAGQEPKEGYVQPAYAGASLRVDGSEAQKMRIKISVPKTEKEIAQVGAIVAPTEVVRDMQLKLGISSVAYYSHENPVLYGVVDGEWVNLTTNTEKYFAASETPNDSDSFISHEEYGGKPSGIYTVYTLPVDDLETPYATSQDADTYTVVFGGAKGEGLFNDFDDFNTFYTIRPYIKYKDGTVTYGEHEYKSLYYIACNLIQPMLNDFNESYADATSQAKKYNMDQMPLATVTDSEGNVIKDSKGKPIYMPSAVGVSTTYSPYTGAAEYSIYLDGRREEVFRWHAVRTVGRRNNNTPLRYDEYANFDPNTKLLVQQYVDMYENIWKVILAAESNRYIMMK